MLSLNSLPNCPPRWATSRRPERKTFGPRIAAFAAKFGQPFMPWQAQVANVGMEVREDGRLAYRKIVVSVPRQCGKTTMLLAWELDRALSWGQRQRIIYSAQTGKDGKEKLLEDQVPILEGSPFKAAIQQVLKTNGSEGVLFRGGSRISIVGSSDSAGHGKTIGLGVIDEAFSDADNAREQALLPAMRTVKNSQLVVASTMGTDTALYLNAIVDGGRLIAEANDPASRTAYFEWSAPDDADIEDPATWWECTPALGYTVEEETIAAELETARSENKIGEFRRASLNQRTSSSERVIPAHIWDKVIGQTAPEGRLVFAVDATPDRARASIAVADKNMRCELVWNEAQNPIAKCVELARNYGATIALDPASPAGAYQEDLERQGVKIIPVTGRDMAKACGFFYDSVISADVSVYQHHPALESAVAAATKRVTGDTWTWARKHTSADISPLVAVTEALWAAQQAPGVPHVWNLNDLI